MFVKGARSCGQLRFAELDFGCRHFVLDGRHPESVVGPIWPHMDSRLAFYGAVKEAEHILRCLHLARRTGCLYETADNRALTKLSGRPAGTTGKLRGLKSLIWIIFDPACPRYHSLHRRARHRGATGARANFLLRKRARMWSRHFRSSGFWQSRGSSSAQWAKAKRCPCSLQFTRLQLMPLQSP